MGCISSSVSFAGGGRGKDGGRTPDDIDRMLWEWHDPNVNAIFDNLPLEYQSDVERIRNQSGGMCGTNGAIKLLANTYLTGNMDRQRNVQKGLQLLEYLADLRDTDALLQLARAYEEGAHGIQQDERKAWHYYLRDLEMKKAHSRERRHYAPPQGSIEKWNRLNGSEVDQSLRSGAIRLLDASWLIRHSIESPSNIIVRRQDLPDDAFLDSNEVVGATKLEEIDFSKRLRVICLSYMWLDKSHPDPRGWVLKTLVRKLKEVVKTDLLNRHNHNWGVFWDFASLYQNPDPNTGQEPRQQWQTRLFKEGLEALSSFYSHPYMNIYKITAFPTDYPTGYSVAEDPVLLKHATVCYTGRGWPYTESCWAGLTQSEGRTIDISRDDTIIADNDEQNDTVVKAFQSDIAELNDEMRDLYCDLFFTRTVRSRELEQLVLPCLSLHEKMALVLTVREGDLSARQGPIVPDQFDLEIKSRSFTNQKNDKPLVKRLYRSFFEKRFEKVEVLDFGSMHWGDDDIDRALSCLRLGYTPRLQRLILSSNFASPISCQALANAILTKKVPHLTEVYLSYNLNLRDAGVSALAPAINSMRALHLDGTFVGSEGCRVIADAVHKDPSSRLLEIYLSDNPLIGAGGCDVLALICSRLEVLDLSNCSIYNPSCKCLIEAILSGSPPKLRKLDLSKNPFDDEGCRRMKDLILHCAATLESISITETNISESHKADLKTVLFRGSVHNDNPFRGLRV